MKVLRKYFIVTHKNGKQKLYTDAKYRLLTVAKVTGALLGAVIIMLTLCGMVINDDNPLVDFQLIFIIGFFTEISIGIVFSCISAKLRKKHEASSVGINRKGNKDV